MSLKHAAMLIAALTVFHYYDRFIVEPAQQQETRQFQQLDAVDVTSIVLVGRNDDCVLREDALLGASETVPLEVGAWEHICQH